MHYWPSHPLSWWSGTGIPFQDSIERAERSLPFCLSLTRQANSSEQAASPLSTTPVPLADHNADVSSSASTSPWIITVHPRNQPELFVSSSKVLSFPGCDSALWYNPTETQLQASPGSWKATWVSGKGHSGSQLWPFGLSCPGTLSCMLAHKGLESGWRGWDLVEGDGIWLPLLTEQHLLLTRSRVAGLCWQALTGSLPSPHLRREDD